MENKELIPFSKELWETGEYELANKENVHIQEVFNDRVYFRHKLIDDSWGADSSEFINNNLILRKKTKKKWAPLLRGHLYSIKEECELRFKGDENFIKAIEVEM